MRIDHVLQDSQVVKCSFILRGSPKTPARAFENFVLQQCIRVNVHVRVRKKFEKPGLNLYSLNCLFVLSYVWNRTRYFSSIQLEKDKQSETERSLGKVPEKEGQSNQGSRAQSRENKM